MFHYFTWSRLKFSFGNTASISDRTPSYCFGSFKLVPKVAKGSSTVNPGLSVAISNRTPPGSRKYREDRKSTRLNSSHVKTSYAVFCLKKKTIRYNEMAIKQPR